jgi:ligand-binding sensor domain-containing protein/signal transduction histidine kinase
VNSNSKLPTSLYTLSVLLFTFANAGPAISHPATSQYPETRYGQTPSLRFDHLSLEQGLSQSTVNAIVQDALGFMWFGTQDGLNRFDGYNVVTYKHNPDDASSISDNGIWCMLRDRSGDLWIGTMRGGLNQYSSMTDKFVSFKHDPMDPHSISENNVVSLFEDSHGMLWVGTSSKGLDRFDRQKKQFHHYRYDSNEPQSLVDSTVLCIGEDTKNNLWIGTWSGLYKLPLGGSVDPPSNQFNRYKQVDGDVSSLSGNNVRTLFVDHTGTLWVGILGRGLNRYVERTDDFKHYRSTSEVPHSLSSDLVFSLFEDVRGNLWIGTQDGGLNLYNRTLDDFTVFRHDSNTPSSLNNDIIAAIYEDHTGVLWIGTGAGGVNWHDPKKNRFTHVRDDQGNPSDLEGNDVWAITEDGEGDLWVGTYGEGVNRYVHEKNKFVHYKHLQNGPGSLSSDNILSLCTSRDGTIWVGTEGGGLNKFDRSRDGFVVFRKDQDRTNSLGGDEVTRILEDSEGYMWIGTNGFGVDRFDRQKNVFVHYRPQENDAGSLGGTSVMAIFEDKEGFVWIGTWGGGVSRYDRKTDSFVRFQNDPDDPRSLNNNTVLSLYEDGEGALWVGTYGGGLNRFDRNTRTFTHYTESDGLPNNVIYGILPDTKGNLWLSTNKGVSRFSLANRTFKNYDAKDGLQGNEFNQGAYYRSRSGRLFLGGINGFNVFFPDSIRDNADIPPVVLTSFRVFDTPLHVPQSIAATTSLHLSHDQNFFSIEFVALSFTSPEKNTYAYMLEGLDGKWVNAGTRRYASYTNLDPGNYTLRVKGSNNDGVWNEQGVTVSITITPPYWKTWWFRLLLLAAVSGILFLMYRYRVRKLLEIERIRASIATDLHDDIGSTLTEIALFSDVGIREIRSLIPGKPVSGSEVEKVTTLLEEIGRTSRTLIDSMNDIVWAIDPKNDSFEYLLLRMKTHAARMMEAKGINYDIEIPAELSELKLPLGFRRRFFLIFKEAINNIIKHAHPTKVLLTIKTEENLLVMTIMDNGVGFDTRTADSGNGLRNMQGRASALGGSLSIASTLAGGTTITLRAAIP